MESELTGLFIHAKATRTYWHQCLLKTAKDPTVDSYSSFLINQCVGWALACSHLPRKTINPECERTEAPNAEHVYELSLKRVADNLFVRSWDRIHLGVWHAVPVIWREIHAISCLLESLLFAWSCTKLGTLVDSNASWTAAKRRRRDESGILKNRLALRDFYLAQALYYADLGLMLGGGDIVTNEKLHAFVNYLQATSSHSCFSVTPGLVDTGTPLVGTTEGHLDQLILHGVAEEPATISLEDFVANYYSRDRPVIIRGYATGWPAIQKWAGFQYLHRKFGSRTVPVEIGTSYAETKWKQKLMPLGHFLETYVQNEDPPDIGYLAQHPIFEQMTELEEDIQDPELVFCGDEPGLIKMMWMGPGGTVSPLHTDPYQNLFVQIVGSKYVRLYDPAESSRLYPYTEGLLTNTSMVKYDLLREEIENDRFPLFSLASYQDTVIRPGDTLYIPKKWWHFVKSLEPSISISYWFS